MTILPIPPAALMFDEYIERIPGDEYGDEDFACWYRQEFIGMARTYDLADAKIREHAYRHLTHQRAA